MINYKIKLKMLGKVKGRKKKGFFLGIRENIEMGN
jgi:hypothetical protein